MITDCPLETLQNVKEQILIKELVLCRFLKIRNRESRFL